MDQPRHFLRFNDLTAAEARVVLKRAAQLREHHQSGRHDPTLAGKSLGMIFEKSSTRTRVSFETGMFQLGGHALFLSPNDTQLGRGEPIEDTARVFNEMLDVVMIRTFAHTKIEDYARFSTLPVINALTDDHHPCQILADIQCFEAHNGDIQGKKVAWIGDGNNMANSWIDAAGVLDFELTIACPEGYEPPAELVRANARNVTVVRSAAEAAANADCVTTDVWASMGQESEQTLREAAFAGYQVNEALLDCAKDSVMFLHCLPAHRGEEVSHTVLDDPRSHVWEEAGNRLHAQKALMEFLVLGDDFPTTV